ncbi:MAG: hypothetical protein AAFQ06_05170 [Pseudomonadota bacterium]
MPWAALAAEPDELAGRIEAGLNEIWPEERYEIRFEGCAMIQRHTNADAQGWDTTGHFWLADWQTAPDAVNTNAQAMTDGTEVWEDVNVWYDPVPEMRNDPGRAALRSALDEVSRAAEPGFMDRLLGRQAGLAEATALFADIEAGAFGPRMARNRGWAERLDGAGAGEIYGYPDTGLGFTFRGEVAPGIIADFHAYAVEACAGQ